MLGFLRRLEYASASFYCRQWLKSAEEHGEAHPITLFFKNLFADEFMHLRYMAQTWALPNVAVDPDVKAAKAAFVEQQRAIISAPVSKSGNHLTPLAGVRWGCDMVGIGSRFLTFKVMFGKRFTKDLPWDEMIAMICVVDESNHLFYRALNLLDRSRNYAPLYTHRETHKSEYKASRKLLAKWAAFYGLALILMLPIDLVRIARYQLR